MYCNHLRLLGIPAPVLINFPLPAWATRSEEVEDKDLDKQAQEFAGKFRDTCQ